VTLTRRRLLELGFVAPVVFVATRWFGASEASARELTPACTDHPTDSNALGPFFKPRSPKRRSLRRGGVKGIPLLVTGTVMSKSCKPVAGALLDFWQADGSGQYDNSGFRLRGHQLTDRNGRYRLETVMPGLYPGRTRHIHVRAKAPGRSVLTTQLFFPGEARNQVDFLFDEQLRVKWIRSRTIARHARFDFVLDLG
jgi:protocatechuate 3,4-dioxygenase beta subunit